MPQFNVHEAKSNLSRLLELAIEGEEVIISRHDVPLVRLTPVRTKRGDRILGSGRGTVRVIDEHWADPMTDEEADAFWDGRG